MTGSKKAVRPMGMVRCNTSVPFASPFAERYCRQEENRKLVCAIKHVKPQVDNTPPRRCPHLQDNKKKELLIEQRYAKIERENAILLDRLCLIARPRCTTVKPKPILPGIALDVHLRPVIDNQETDARLPVRSLNAVTRKQELIRVMKENQAILERIYSCKGVYSSEKWRQDREQQEKYAAMRRRYLGPVPSDPSASDDPNSPETVYQVGSRPCTAGWRAHTVHGSRNAGPHALAAAASAGQARPQTVHANERRRPHTAA